MHEVLAASASRFAERSDYKIEIGCDEIAAG
jgi:hypothetical protein